MLSKLENLSATGHLVECGLHRICIEIAVFIFQLIGALHFAAQNFQTRSSLFCTLCAIYVDCYADIVWAELIRIRRLVNSLVDVPNCRYSTDPRAFYCFVRVLSTPKTFKQRQALIKSILLPVVMLCMLSYILINWEKVTSCWPTEEWFIDPNEMCWILFAIKHKDREANLILVSFYERRRSVLLKPSAGPGRLLLTKSYF
jgi:hypothetical protein